MSDDNGSSKISRDDIKSKLADIQGEATDTVEGAKNQLVAVGIGVALVLLLLAFFLGRRGGVRKSTIIEVKRA
ncbi:MAG: hypothetical protein V9E99_15365 [Microthrixaceae bacterium]|jgi:hypothetical protein|nr:hypothetical protein [Actinomycetota bacterium]HMS12599.1 hypothetical protein [Microthrixaceae bacterium]HMT23814.1 hypothetical protein [Microthrixaceae bacterium]HMT59704.1 hypothetical protein [Microthrixaceae bacterium]